MECTNVERAYNAWFWEPTTSLDWSQFQVQMRMEDGDDFLAAVSGYTDDPALELAVAIANYNVEMSLINADFTINGSADTSKADVARVDVVDTYDEFAKTTCAESR